MAAPVVAAVRSGPDVERDVSTVRAEVLGELIETGMPKRILVAGVDPDRQAEIGTGRIRRCLQYVVAFEVG
jgi:hypothetical protein